MRSSCNFIIRIISECKAFSPSKKKRSRIIFENQVGVLQSIIVMQYWENIVRSHSKSISFWQIDGTCSAIRVYRIQRRFVRPRKLASKISCQFFHTITPMKIQKTRSSNIFSYIENTPSSSSFSSANSVNSEPAIKFIPCVYSFFVSAQQPIKIFLSSFRQLVTLLLRGTSFSIWDRISGRIEEGWISYLQGRVVIFFSYWVLAKSYQTFLRTQNFMPLRMEKQMFFFGYRERFRLSTIQFHSSTVNSLASSSLLTKIKSFRYIFQMPQCSSSSSTTQQTKS